MYLNMISHRGIAIEEVGTLVYIPPKSDYLRNFYVVVTQNRFDIVPLCAPFKIYTLPPNQISGYAPGQSLHYFALPAFFGNLQNEKQEVQLSLRDHASTLSVDIW